jgi:hypothetical protein
VSVVCAATSRSAGRQSNSARENKVLKNTAVTTNDKAGVTTCGDLPAGGQIVSGGAEMATAKRKSWRLL